MKGLWKLVLSFNSLHLRLGRCPYQIAILRNKSRFLVDLRSTTERPSYWLGSYDEEAVKLLAQLVNEGEAFLDIGSNIGFYSVQVANLLLKTKGIEPKVYTFEPLGQNIIRQKANIQINSLEEFCNVFEFGLSDANQTLNITLREDFVNGSSTGNAAIETSDAFDTGFSSVAIRVNTLDSVWEQISSGEKISVIKMDVEGHEDYVLRGGQQVINRFRPIIYLEVNKPYYKSRGVGDVHSLLTESLPCGYSIFRKFPSGRFCSIDSIDQCSNLDNVFFCPDERSDFFIAIANN